MPYMVQAEKDIRPGTVVSTELVSLVYQKFAPENACYAIEDAVNKIANTLIPKGSIVTTTVLSDS